MTYFEANYDGGMQKGRERRAKTKREQAADAFNKARQLAREALEEENSEMALVKEYGPRCKVTTPARD